MLSELVHIAVLEVAVHVGEMEGFTDLTTDHELVAPTGVCASPYKECCFPGKDPAIVQQTPAITIRRAKETNGEGGFRSGDISMQEHAVDLLKITCRQLNRSCLKEKGNGIIIYLLREVL